MISKVLLNIFVGMGCAALTFSAPAFGQGSGSDRGQTELVEGGEDYRVFLQSRSVTERKVPATVSKQWRQNPDGDNSLRTRFGMPSAGERGQGAPRQLYRVDGSDTASINMLMAALGATPQYVSTRRPYVTVELTAAEVRVLSESDAITRVRKVIGPRAKGNAALAHDIATLKTGNGANNGNLSGDGVVIGLISLPFSASLLSSLEAAGAVPTQASGDLSILGSAKVTCDANANPDPCAGLTADALNMLQVVHEIAPDAKVVVGSPGSTSEPGQMAAVIDSMVAGGEGADIIFDDLYYPSQNPFEVDEVSEAISDARAAGTLYLTAAGDGGHAATTSTSSVYVAALEAVNAANTAAAAIDEFITANDTIHNFGGDELITVSESLADVCLFSNQNPTQDFSTALTAFIYNESDEFVGSVDGFGCLSQDDPESALPLAADSSIVVLVNTANAVSRFMLTTERASPPAALALTSDTLSQTTAGNILGHAYSADAVTVSAVSLCTDSGTTKDFSDATACPPSEITPTPYSADGEGAQVSRFFWQMDSESDWQAIEGGVAVAKPSVATIGTEVIQVWDGNALASGNFVGTSASVAVASGIAALYWEYRAQTQTNTVVLSAEVAAALRDATTEAGGAGFDILFGHGVSDAPKAVGDNVFDQPLPAQQVQLSSAIGGATLTFNKALDDTASNFIYEVECGENGALLDDDILPVGGGGTAGENMVPVFVAATGEVQCTVTPRKNAATPKHDASATTVSAAPVEVAPVSVTMTAKAGGAVMSFTASALETSATVSYSASCTAGGQPISGWNPKTNAASVTEYIFQRPAGTTITCSVTVSAQTPAGGTVTSEAATSSATATNIDAATASFSADSGGIIVTWTPDPDLASPDMASGTVVCFNASTSAEVVRRQLSGSSTFIQAEPGVALSCSVTTVISINGENQSPSTTSSVNVTPEEELITPMPIWLLYKATQS